MRAEAQDARSIAPMHIKRFETIGWLREEGVYILERVVVMHGTSMLFKWLLMSGFVSCPKWEGGAGIYSI